MADEYIRRKDAIIEMMDNNVDHAQGTDGREVVQILSDIPAADVVSVVRCKDCKYNATTHKCLNPDSFFLIPKDDDFCSYGERREG